MAEREALTADFVRQILDYDPATGVFRWKARTPDMFRCSTRSAADNCAAWNTRLAGRVTGSLNAGGYLVICINNRLYRAHRIAWLIVVGEWPKEEIDHINIDPSDNRFVNLRLATRGQNEANKRAYSNNKSGRKGVRLDKQSGKWKAEISNNGRRCSLGCFDDIDAAAAAYEAAARELHGEFARVE